MSLVLPFERVTGGDRPRVGGKGYALSVLARTGVKVPSGVCVTADAYSTINDDCNPGFRQCTLSLRHPTKNLEMFGSRLARLIEKYQKAKLPKEYDIYTTE